MYQHYKFGSRTAVRAFILVLITSTIVVWSRARIYQAEGVLRYDPPDYQSASNSVTEKVADSSPSQTIADISDSFRNEAVINYVIKDLNESDRLAFEAPFLSALNGHKSDLVGAINRAVSIIPDVGLATLRVRYRHPDRRIATTMARLHTGAWITHLARERVDADLNAQEFLIRRMAELDREAQLLRSLLAKQTATHADSATVQVSREPLDESLAPQLEVVGHTRALIYKRFGESQISQYGPLDWLITELPTIPEADDYLIGPIVVNFLIGLGVAVAVGGICGAFNQRLISVFGRMRKRAVEA